ncbi:MAG: hypothetical protein QOI13_1505 [Paraburkholderia sp.]|nr:hypothetical protein [Paraburkholderia sp.]
MTKDCGSRADKRTDVSVKVKTNVSAYALDRLRPLAFGVTSTATLCYLLFTCVRHIGAAGHAPVPLAARMAVTAVLALLCLALYCCRTPGQYGLSACGFVAILTSGVFLNAAGTDFWTLWTLPAFSLILVASAPFWLSISQYALGTALAVTISAVAADNAVINRFEWVIILMYSGTSVLVSGVFFFLFGYERRQHMRLEQELTHLAHFDMLTGLLNRHAFLMNASATVHVSDQRGLPLHALYLDLDNFKKLNDAHGHAEGDRVLREFGALIQKEVPRNSLLGRVGGEEFVALVCQGGKEDALALANRIRDQASSVYRPDAPLTLSVGVATRIPGEALDHLLARADSALLDAKRAGRNLVVLNDYDLRVRASHAQH